MTAEVVGVELVDVFLAVADEGGGNGGGDIALYVAGGEEEKRHCHDASDTARTEAIDGVVDAGLSEFEEGGLNRLGRESIGDRAGEGQELLDAGWAARAMGDQ
jgi:hypothetical protein